MKGNVIFLTTLFLLSMKLAADEAYVLLDVEVKGHVKSDPVWLAVEGPGGWDHWRIEKYIFPVSSGEYRIHHIDFNKSIKVGHSSLHIGRRESLSFDVKSGFVNYLGTLLVEKKGRNNFEMKFGAEESLVRLACELNPRVFSEFKVIVPLLPEPRQQYQIDCANQMFE